MTSRPLDKNLRLGPEVRPTRYEAHLDLDTTAHRFRGTETIALQVSTATTELVLHAVGLEVVAARAEWQGHVVPATPVEAPVESQALVLRLGEPVGPGEVSLHVEWTGAFSPGLRGLYAAGSMAVTQFEAADARRVFPCFDEPSFKATWRLAVTAPADAVVLSNSKVEAHEVADGRRTVRFAVTPPLPTYLVALACGALESSPELQVGAVALRTWTPPGKVHLTGFAQEVAAAVLPRLEAYFGLPYAFGKMDQLAVPDFEAGAMENAGLVTYRELALLLDPATAALPTRKRVAEIITHELAHQWFGNLVTMAWWDDLWLNEAFATWMAYKVVDGWKPEWRVWLDFDAGKAAALQLDALVSTHPILAEVRNADEAGESFDLITYEKGGAVLRMIEGYLGEDAFRDGLRLYMRRYQQGNAVADDLWEALAEASGQPIRPLADAWVRTPGYPVVGAARDGHTLTLRQRRFLSEPGQDAEGLWPVPVVLRFADGQGVHEHRVLLEGSETRVELQATDGVRWLVANALGTGFYRVAYAADDVVALGEHLAHLTVAERIALLSDEWALLRRGEREPEVFFDLLTRFGEETDHAVLDAVVARLTSLERACVAEDDLPRFRAWVARALGGQLAQAGWDERAGESGGEKQRRAALVAALGLVARDPSVLREATARLDRAFAGDTTALAPDVHAAAVTIVARDGDAARFEQLLRAAETETDPAYRRRYLLGLAAFEEPGLVARAVGMVLQPAVPLQELAFFVAGLLVNPAARDTAWTLLRSRWDDVLAKSAGAPMVLRHVVESLAALPERRHLDEVRRFLAEHPVESARQAVAQTLERMAQDVAFAERLRPAVSRWLGVPVG